MAIAGILFDVEDVFFDGTFWHRYLHQTACRLGRQQQFDNLQADWQKEFLPKVYAGELQYWDALASFFRSWGLNECEVRELTAVSQPRLKQAQAGLRLFPHVSETLQTLKKQGLKVGVISNSIHEPAVFVEMLRRIGLRVELDFVATSRGERRRMPDQAAFGAAATSLGIQPDQIAYVSVRSERLTVATQFGLPVIRVIKTGPGGPNFSENNVPAITSLSELFKAIAKIDAPHGPLARQI
jgi:FMN phosphatase YigB (HAD superfamily)